MVLRKPYAFIIRHFRLIHLLLTGCILFVLKHFLDINHLFSSLQMTNTLTYAGAGNYINNFIFSLILVIIALTAVIFWLLREKKKPTILYLGTLIFYCILIIVTLYFNSVLSTLMEENITTDMILFVKDFSFLVTLPQYAFLVLCFIRGVGFDIKRFNFSKDIEELQIVDKDSQEFELLIGQNNYKYKRFIRRALRETKYYILENKYVISGVLALIIISVIGAGIYYYNTYLKSANESELISVNSISYVVNKSYITEYDYVGNKIKDGYKYVVLDMTFYNGSAVNKTLDLSIISLANGDLVYRPILTRNGKFYDIGTPYYDKQIILPNDYLDATLTFEIPSTVRTKNFRLRVQYALDNIFDNVISRYRTFAISAANIDKNNEIKTIALKSPIESNIIGQNRFDITVNDYKINDTYDNKYIVCETLDKCDKISSIVKVQDNSRSTMLILDYTGTIYEDAKFTKQFNTYNKIFTNYAFLRYRVYSEDFFEPVKVIGDEDVRGKIFLEVSRKIVNASEISLELHFRNNVYIIPLK